MKACLIFIAVLLFPSLSRLEQKTDVDKQHPNMQIEQLFKEVRRAVQEETNNQQTPWVNTSLSGDFHFKDKQK